MDEDEGEEVMQKYTEEFLDECCETMVKADEIKENKELMHELEPYMKEKGTRITELPGTLKEKYQAKLNDSFKKEEAEKEDSYSENKIDGEKPLAKEDEKIPAKA